MVLLKKPKSILEIGVFTGQRSKQMLMAASIFSQDIDFYGFDLFEDFEEKILSEEFSKKPLNKDEIFKKLNKYGNINLFKGYTNKTLPEFAKHNKKIDFIFIDGGHSIETINSDWKWVEKIMHKKTTVLFDDYYDNSQFIKKFGCNELIKNLNKKKYEIKIYPLSDKFNTGNKLISNKIVQVNFKQ